MGDGVAVAERAPGAAAEVLGTAAAAGADEPATTGDGARERRLMRIDESICQWSKGQWVKGVKVQVLDRSVLAPLGQDRGGVGGEL